MGKIIIGGGGISLDDVTATPANVLQGKTAYMKDGDDPAGGTMPNNGAWAGRIGVNGRAAIPAGYHNGSGYVDQSIPTLGAQTVIPGNSQKVVSCSGKYMTGNVTVPAVAGLTAANIKKGVTVGGVTGTFEGWVPTPQDLYYKGINNARFTPGDYLRLDNDRISVLAARSGDLAVRFGREYNVTSYSRLIVEGRFSPFLAASNVCGFEVVAQGKSSKSSGPGGTVTSITVDISIFSLFSIDSQIRNINIGAGSYITRIRLE